MSMISSTPLSKNKSEIPDSTVSDVSLTPILYEELEKDPKTPFLRTQYDKILAKSNNGKVFRQVKLNERQELSADQSSMSSNFLEALEQTPRETKNATKYANLLFESKLDTRSKFNTPLPYGDDYLPSQDEDKQKIFKKKKTQKRQVWSNVYRLLSDPSIPYTLSLYLQLVLNAVIIGFIILFIWTFVSTIRNDVSKRIDEMTFKLLKEISLCSKEYDRNNCHPSVRVPAADKACSVWEHCMNQDPTSVGQVKISFEILAEILNSFVKLLSWKTIFVLMLLIIGSLIVTNLVFDRYRYNYHAAVPQQQQLIQETTSYGGQFRSPYPNNMIRNDLSLQSPTVRFSEYSNNRKKWD